MPAAGELVRDLLRPLKTRVPQDHRQADHVVTPRAVVGENLGGRLRLGIGDALPLETRFHSPRLPPAPSGKRIEADFPQQPFGELAGLAAALVGRAAPEPIADALEEYDDPPSPARGDLVQPRVDRLQFDLQLADATLGRLQLFPQAVHVLSAHRCAPLTVRPIAPHCVRRSALPARRIAAIASAARSRGQCP